MNNDSKLPISLKLKQINPLPDRIKKYFDICLEKLGYVSHFVGFLFAQFARDKEQRSLGNRSQPTP